MEAVKPPWLESVFLRVECVSRENRWGNESRRCARMRALTSKALLHIGPGWRSSQTARARTTCTAGGGNVELIGTWSISPRKSHGPPPSIGSLSRPANAPSSCLSGRHLLGSARVHGLALLCGWAGYPRNLTSTGEGRRETDRGGQQKRPRWIAMAELRCTPSLLGPVHFLSAVHGLDLPCASCGS